MEGQERMSFGKIVLEVGDLEITLDVLGSVAKEMHLLIDRRERSSVQITTVPQRPSVGVEKQPTVKDAARNPSILAEKRFELKLAKHVTSM
jgi:hypothetical protein